LLQDDIGAFENFSAADAEGKPAPRKEEGKKEAPKEQPKQEAAPKAAEQEPQQSAPSKPSGDLRVYSGLPQ
jgi:hypothetical protein